MVKIGILSMQRIANYGSFLQAYGLKSIFEELGCKVQFVDYHPGKTLISPDGRDGLRRKISKSIEVLKCYAPLKEKIKFIVYKKNYAINYYPYLEIDSKMVYAPEVDVQVIGSDEVFNCVQNNVNVGFSPELFGRGNNAKRLISFAASFGNTTEKKLREYGIISKVGKWIKMFDAISVRDINSVKIIKTIANVIPEYHLDPVLIYDFLSKCEHIPITIPDSGYLILYGYSGRFSKKECETIKKYAKKSGLKIICIGGIQDVCDKFAMLNPFEAIAYFKNSECVVTDTFHGTIFSVITHKPFISVIRKDGYGNSEKLTDLLNRLMLKDRIIENIDAMEELLLKKIDYKLTDKIINEERKRAYAYLEKQIKLVNIGNN